MLEEDNMRKFTMGVKRPSTKESSWLAIMMNKPLIIIDWSTCDIYMLL